MQKKFDNSYRNSLVQFFLFLIGFLFFSCQSTQMQMISTIGDTNFMDLEELEYKIIELRFQTNEIEAKNQYAYIENKIARLKQQAFLNKEYLAQLYGFEGELYSLSNNRAKIKIALQAIQKLRTKTDWDYILAAYCEPDITKRITILKQSSQKNIAQLKLALAYFDANEYEHATAAFDNALMDLPKIYQQYYAEKRNAAYLFIQNPPKSPLAKALFSEPVVKYEKLLSILYEQTPFFAHFQIDTNNTIASLFEQLKNKDYIPPDSQLYISITRGENAKLLARLFEQKIPANELYVNVVAYQKRGRSPIGDVPLNHTYFSYIIFAIEKDIMELHDGENFLPSTPISGGDFHTALEKLLLLYQRQD